MIAPTITTMIPVDNMSVQTTCIILTTVFSLINAVFASFMWRMKATFVPRAEMEKEFATVHSEAEAEFCRLEAKIERLDERVRVVEQNAAGAAADIRAVGEAVGRVERLTLLQIEFKYKEAAANG